MEAIKLTYLEAMDLYNNGIAIYDETSNTLNEEQIADLFFLNEEEEINIYIIDPR